MTATKVLKHEEIKPLIGSRVLNTKEELLTGDYADQIRELLEERGVRDPGRGHALAHRFACELRGGVHGFKLTGNRRCHQCVGDLSWRGGPRRAGDRRRAARARRPSRTTSG